MTDDTRTLHATGVAWMREASRYIRAHRGETFVVYVGGEALLDDGLEALTQDLVLLRGLGVRLILVHGARPQIESSVSAANITPVFAGELRVTDAASMACVRSAVSSVRIELEARLSQAALDMPNRGTAITISGGNFVVARPVGVVNGIDLQFTGELRRIDRRSIERRLEFDELVLVSPLGYSPTGEVFNLNAINLATAVACEVKAAKLIFMAEPPGITDSAGKVARQLTVGEARAFRCADTASARLLEQAVKACQFGVGRVHIVDRTADGVLIAELFTRDGVGTLVSNTPFDHLRLATIDDVGGILNLIEPLEHDGSLVKRSREKLEMEIDHFSVIVREGIVVACGALYPFASGTGELACVAVHPDYRCGGFGNVLLNALERRAAETGLNKVFVLTTRATHWFQEQGYKRVDIESLPVERQALYNVQRNSIVLLKDVAR